MKGKDIWVLVGVIALIVLILGVLGGGMMGWGMMGPWMTGWRGFGGWGILMVIVMLLFWAVVIGGIVLLLIWLFRQGQPSSAGSAPSGSRAIDILGERYARGEITREQYEQMRRDLTGE